MPKRRDDDNGSTPPGDEESPSGAHRRPAGSDESWREKTDPNADARVKAAPLWWAKPVTLPWGALLAIAGVGAGGAGTTMLSDVLMPDEVVTEAELQVHLDRVEAEQSTRQTETERKLDAISRDIADLHGDIESLTDIIDRAFPRFPDRSHP